MFYIFFYIFISRDMGVGRGADAEPAHCPLKKLKVRKWIQGVRCL